MAQPSRIARKRSRYIRSDLKLEGKPFTLGAWAQEIDGAFSHVDQIEVDLVEPELARFHARQVEDVVDDGQQCLPGEVDGVYIALCSSLSGVS